MPEDKDGNYVAPLAKPSVTKQSSRDEATKFLQQEVLRLKLQSEGLEKEKQALIEEYVVASDEDAPEKIKKNIRALMPDAIVALSELLETGKEATRASIAKYVIDRGLNPDALGGASSADKEFNKLLGDLQKNDA